MNRLKTCMLLATVAIASSCVSTPAVFTDSDPEQDFSNYQSYSWIDEKPMTASGDHHPSAIDERRIMSAIRNEMVAKGFEFTLDRTKADFVVAFTVGARDKIDVRTEVVDYYGNHWRWGYDYYSFSRPIFVTRPQTAVRTRQYAEGMLAIDVFDTGRKSPVWHGSASKRLSTTELRGPNGESIKAAVSTILISFPPEQS